VSARAEAATHLSDRVSAITASATGARGAVRVTVAASGVMTALELDDTVGRMRGADLATTIMATMRRAQAGLANRVAEVTRDTVGVDSETGRAVVRSYAERFPPLTDRNPGDGDHDGQ
jgi:hypothetical protein